MIDTKFLRCGLAIATALLLSALPKLISAQDQYDPPDRVARLGYIQGAVSFEPAGESEWVGAVPNRPMTTGDQLWTDENSRAEVQLGSAVIRLGPNTGFSFLNLDDNTVQIQLTTGSISVTVRRLEDQDDFEVDTPNQAFTAIQPGHYRIDASPDGTYTVVTARSGYGQSTGAGQTFNVQGGQQVTFSGTDQLYADVEPINGYDQFDQWSDGRDQRFAQSRSGMYLERDVVGYEDLDEYGDWRDDPQYGHVWYPNQVDVGWAPYHVGHWDWISPWGWTWVDDQPWGYAPFHYGRWISVGGRWGWVAGPTQVRAVYAPALVVFLGGVSGGNVGWFPLGPREVFVPSYHVSQNYVTRVNIANTTVNVVQVTNIYNTTIVRNNVNITNVTYANRDVRGAVMAVPQAAFVSAQPVGRAAVTMNARDIAGASVTARVAVVPTQASVLGPRAGMGVRVAAPPQQIAARVVVAKKTPPPPPVPFVRQQQGLALHPGQALAPAELHSLAPPVNATAARPMVKQAPPGRPATPTTGRPLVPAPVQMGVRPGTPATLPQPGGTRPAVAAPAAPQTYQNNRPVAPAPTERPVQQPPAEYHPPVTEPGRQVAPPAQTNRTEPQTQQPAPRPQPPVPQERQAPPPQQAPPVQQERQAPPPQQQRPVQPQERSAPPPPQQERQQPQARPAPEPKDQPKKDDKNKPKDEKKPE